MLTRGAFSNWGNGWRVGGGASYPINSSTEVALNISYHRYPYRGENLQLVFPAIAGLRWSVSGEPSNVIEASVALRFNASSSFINPFLSLRAGLYRLSIGEIIISTWFNTNPENTSQSTYAGSGVSTTKGFAALGFGFSLPLYSGIRFGLEGQFAQSFDQKVNFIPVLSTIQVDL